MDIETEAKRLGEEVLAVVVAEAGASWDSLDKEDLSRTSRAALFAGRIIAFKAAGQPVSRTDAATYLAALGTLESVKVTAALTAKTLVLHASMRVLDKVLAAIGSGARKMLFGM